MHSPLVPAPDQLDLVRSLRPKIEELESRSKAVAMAVAVQDLETGLQFRYRADRWFHAASTIKLAVLLGTFAAIHQGKLVPQSRLHVRNRFRSAHDGSSFRVTSERDADSEVQGAIGKTMRIHELARNMIIRSSNLATNLLLDLLGIEFLQRVLEQHELSGIDLRRGVEDELAFEHGINNRVTADGLVQLLRLIADEKAFSPTLSRQMLDVLHEQEFRSGIPAGLPATARVAHKTGEISTIAHDAGIVYLPKRKPYVVAILTEWEPRTTGRSPTIAAASYMIYEHLMGGKDEDDD
ncbi:MAG TPA: serine hydrolase [Gemmatimonadaceae bacterium]|nr:serine hydrolase [Gemmatimonadaceae bacterium]